MNLFIDFQKWIFKLYLNKDGGDLINNDTYSV